MIGLGMDLCQISRIQKAIEKNPGFLERYYTPDERAYLADRGQTAAQSAAAMFAAKEAFLKALGTGLGSGVALSDIGVLHGSLGAPQYALTGPALEKLHALGATRAFLSLTHESDMAGAVAVIE